MNDEEVNIVEEALQEDAKKNYIPQFKMYTESRIPVAKVEGKLWKSRLEQCKNAMKDVTEHWDKALRYFNIDHVGYRLSEQDSTTVENASVNKLKEEHKCKENLIYANIMGMLPNLYSQNPSIEVSPNVNDDYSEQTCTVLERLVNVILSKRVNPGVNMQPKARKAIINSMITNRGVIKIGWTNKITTNNDTLMQLDDIRQKLLKAKDVKEIEKLEGQLIALNEMVDFSDPSCLYVQHIQPVDLFVDPSAQEQDGSDAKWMMERTFLPTEWLIAKFGIDKKDQDTMSVYKPTHILKTGKEDSDDNYKDVLNNNRFNDNYGYDNTESYKKAQLTECFWIWDKTKRRVLLYSSADWDYPIWVYDDPYKLQEFFPYYILNLTESPNSTLCHGEVSLYLDQQDEVNMINAKLHGMREFGFNHYLFNTNSQIPIKQIQDWANGGESIVGISLPEGVKFEDVLFAGQQPYDKNQILYDKSDLFRQIDAASGTDAVTRSGEYKTNTTNMAIQTYMAGKNAKMDDKRDIIERWLGQIGFGMIQLLLEFMTTEQVSEILGQDVGSMWRNFAPEEIRTNFSLTVVGGSTLRPNSVVKQQQALQLTQLLGQFASSTPMVVVVMLKMLARSFDNFVIKQEDIQMIIDSIQQQLMAQQQQQQSQADLAQQKANTEVVNQANQIQQASQLPESVQNTILNQVMNQQPTPPVANNGVENNIY